MGKTKIEWAGSTWNPVVGCTLASPGCTHCYAMAMAGRIQRMNPGNHYAGTTVDTKAGPVWTGKIVGAPDSIFLAPLRKTKPETWFVNSMGDLHHEATPIPLIDKAYAIMALTPRHTYQVLTKRAAQQREYLSDPVTPARIAYAMGAIAATLGRDQIADGRAFARRMTTGEHWPLPNVWNGVSAEDQRRADERLLHLAKTPTALRWVSAEPLIGPINFRRIPVAAMEGVEFDALTGLFGWSGIDVRSAPKLPAPLPGLDWIITGGESGSRARPMHPAWPRSILQQTRLTGTAFFHKQNGEWAALQEDEGEWPTDTGNFIRVRFDGMRADEGWPMQRVGKSFSGRKLDGVEYSGMPEVRT